MRTIAPHRPDLLTGYWEATQLNAANLPVDPVSFQQAIDGIAKLIKLNGWQDPAEAVLRQWKAQHGIAA